MKNNIDGSTNQINKLISYRENIINNLTNIQEILRQHFPKEYEIAYQFWIPQIITALHDNSNWLPRGERNMQQTIDRLTYSITELKSKGLSKYITE